MTKEQSSAAGKTPRARKSASKASLRVVRDNVQEPAAEDVPEIQSDAGDDAAASETPLAGTGLAVDDGAACSQCGEPFKGEIIEGFTEHGKFCSETCLTIFEGKSTEDAKTKDDAEKPADELAGHDTKPQQPFLGGKDAAKAGMSPNYPPAVIDAAYATLNARRDFDAASAKYKEAAVVLVQRMDKNKLRYVRVPNEKDLVFRIEAPEARLKMDGYKKPKGGGKKTKATREKKQKTAKPTKDQREAAAKTKADAAQKTRRKSTKSKASKKATARKK